MNAFERICLILLCSMLVVAIAIPLYAIPTNYEYDLSIGSFFELSDKASKLDVKLVYLKQYAAALENAGLDTGQTTVFFPTRETSLEENYRVLSSLVTRMEEISGMEIDSFQYQTAMQQITENEYCWFHEGVFRQGYLLKKGFWPLALFPSSSYNRCGSE